MAARRKIRLREPAYRKTSDTWTTQRPGGYYGKGRTVMEKAIIRRTWGSKGRWKKVAFQACLIISHATKGLKFLGRRRPGGTIQCGHGKNPRAALAAAHRVMASTLSRRSGAFAGSR